ncbi:MAG: phosphatase domain-containing protein [Paracoccaceae bacterium]
MSKKKKTSAKPVEIGDIENQLANSDMLSTPEGRFRARMYYTWVDHGFLRVFWTNFWKVSPGVWRSNQPSQRRIAKYKSKGINTIINLRGAKPISPYFFELQACEDLGINLISFSLSARKMNRREKLLGLLDAFETIDGTFLMHCKSGADRAGLASALYLMHIKGVHVSEAKKQLSFKYLHLRFPKTGILDYMLEKYQTDIESSPMPIREWIETVYDQKEIEAGFKAMRKKS